MTANETKALQVKEKHEVDSPVEHTASGPVYTPDVDIFETEKELVLLADLPGVTAENLVIDLRDSVLTLSGDVPDVDAANEAYLMAEYGTGRYHRQFTLSEKIDQEGIDAKLTNGVLHLTLPKVAKATPRKIAVSAA